MSLPSVKETSILPESFVRSFYSFNSTVSRRIIINCFMCEFSLLCRYWSSENERLAAKSARPPCLSLQRIRKSPVPHRVTQERNRMTRDEQKGTETLLRALSFAYLSTRSLLYKELLHPINVFLNSSLSLTAP